METSRDMEMARADEAARQIAERFLMRPTTKQKMLFQVMHSPDNRFEPICKHLTIDECAASVGRTNEARPCDAVHFEVILHPQTDPSLGHCSYLNTCHRTNKCKYLHFRPVRHADAPPFQWKTIYDDDPIPARGDVSFQAGSQGNLYGYAQAELDESERLYLAAPIKHPARSLYAHGLQQYAVQGKIDPSPELMPAQWIDADLKKFDYSILGKFDVIVADPPWDIHMSLPYGTMSDDDMRAMPFPQLQEEGYLFLWVTGRAMELGRELLAVWGYTRVDEIIWVKVGQTQRLIRTGRTGHWLNHTKEHCLVGVKKKKKSTPSQNEPPLVSPLSSLSSTYAASHAPGLPASALLPDWSSHAVGLDADVIVAEVRDTSRKPDEMYSIIERLCPKGRKVELFGRKHNARPGWITVGNQLKGDHIVDEDLKARLSQWRRRQAR